MNDGTGPYYAASGGSAWNKWSMRRAMDAVLGSNHSINDGPEPAHLLLEIEPDDYNSDDEDEDNSAASAIDSSPAPKLEQDNLSPAHTPEQNNNFSPAQQNERSPISPAGLGVDSNTVPNATIATIDHEDATNDLDDFDGDQEEAFDIGDHDDDDDEEEEPSGNIQNPPSASLAMIRARDQMDDEAEKERPTARQKRCSSAPI